METLFAQTGEPDQPPVITQEQRAALELEEQAAAKFCESFQVSKEALEIHHSGMLFDGHNDLPWAMRSKANSSFDKVDISQPTKFHTDIARLKEGGVKAQFWSVYVPASTMAAGNAYVTTLEQIELVHEMCQRYPDEFELALTADDLERIVKQGKIASMIGVEGGHSIENSLSRLRELYNRGARYMTLTHSKNLDWADACTDEPRVGGLNAFGEEVVREMNEIGMLVDISHVSPECMRKTLAVTEAPVIYSHSSARSLCDHVRNVPDDILKLTAENGGVVMVNFNTGFCLPKDKLAIDRRCRGDFRIVVDHIDHIVKTAGIDHVGIGSDYDGIRGLPRGLEDVSCYPMITQELLNRGYQKEGIHKILGGNALRVLRQAEAVSHRLKAQK
ncbi:MAG: dipeptidase [Pirellulaceae bacterium]|nr:dipeptidase [Pirellulaceae bacterium]